MKEESNMAKQTEITNISKPLNGDLLSANEVLYLLETLMDISDLYNIEVEYLDELIDKAAGNGHLKCADVFAAVHE